MKKCCCSFIENNRSETNKNVKSGILCQQNIDFMDYISFLFTFLKCDFLLFFSFQYIVLLYQMSKVCFNHIYYQNSLLSNV